MGIIAYIQSEIHPRLNSLPRTTPLTVDATPSPEEEINTSEITLGCVLGYCYIHRSFEEMVKNKAAQDAEYAVALSDSSAWAYDSASDDDEVEKRMEAAALLEAEETGKADAEAEVAIAAAVEGEAATLVDDDEGDAPVAKS